MSKFIGIVIILLFTALSGCWVKVSEDGEDISTQEKPKVTPEHIQCFERFKTACINGQWQNAYDELSSAWREKKTLAQFQENMEKVGKEILAGSRIITVVETQQNGEETWTLTTINSQKNRTMFILVQEQEKWKIHGVKNLP